jgi:hypothetical protein
MAQQLPHARPGGEWSKEQRACVDMIIRALQRPTSITIPFRIDRIDKAGSVGKTTDSLYSDLDLVAYFVADELAYLPPNNNGHQNRTDRSTAQSLFQYTLTQH